MFSWSWSSMMKAASATIFQKYYIIALHNMVQWLSLPNKKLSYRRERARQLPTWRGARPSSPLPATPSGYTYAYERIRNPQQTYVKRAVH